MSVRPAKTQISLGIRPVRSESSLCIRPVWSESSLCAQWVAKHPSFLYADSEDSDQTGRMPRLIWVFAGRILTLLVLSCHGSAIFHDFVPNIGHFVWKSCQWLASDQTVRYRLNRFEPPRGKTNNVSVRQAKTQISLGICPGWSESSLGAHSLCWFCHEAAHFWFTG